mmetsp:Transcript_25414/g.40441  ORF Transcript_25414/g.40441 Transcript_25414/m.40441 type:complete len:207 (-) Transcript_25414:156-776(-)
MSAVDVDYKQQRAHEQQQRVDEDENDNDMLELSELDIEFEALDLAVYKHRKHNSYHHPKYMLNDDDTDWYISDINPNFKRHEMDWIVLANKQTDKMCVPLFGEIACNGFMQDVKRMRVEIGNFEQDKWMALNHNNQPFELKQTREKQRFEFAIDDESIVRISRLMKQHNYTHFRLQLIENHGAVEAMYSRFVIATFKLYGIVVGKF